MFSDRLKSYQERIVNPLSRPKSGLAEYDAKKSLWLQLLMLRLGPLLILSLGSALVAALWVVAAFSQRHSLTQLSSNNLGLAVILGIVTAAILFFLTKVCQSYLYLRGLREGGIVYRWLSKAIYDQALLIHPQKKGERSTGEVVGLFASQAQIVAFFLEHTIPQALISISPIFVGPLSLYILYDVPLTAILALVFLNLAFFAFLGKLNANNFQNFKSKEEVRLGITNETLVQIRAIRTLGFTNYFQDRINRGFGEEMHYRLGISFLAAIMNSLSACVPILFNFAAMWYLLVFQTGQSLNAGDVITLTWVTSVFLASPMRFIPWVFVLVYDTMTSLSRIESFLKLPKIPQSIAQYKNSAERSFQNEVDMDSSFPEPKKQVQELAIEIKNLHLEIGNQKILNGIDFTTKEGELVVVIGQVGSGKSSFLKSIVGLVPSQFADFKVRGKDAVHLDLETLRKKFTYISQEHFTISASISENVTFDYEKEASNYLKQIMDSIDASEFSPVVKSMEQGVETQIGERGVNLSGGQKQRLSLARGYFHDHSIILLDDVLSALDVNTEKLLIERLLLRRWKDKTVILTSHRLSILTYADKVILLEDGKICLSGQHHELMNASSKYRDFINAELKNSSEAS